MQLVGRGVEPFLVPRLGRPRGQAAVEWSVFLVGVDNKKTNSDLWGRFSSLFGQTWPQNPFRMTGLVLQCRLHQKSGPQTISWQFGILISPPPMNR